MIRTSEAVEPGTVWTWNAIGKADGAWQLAPGADEARKGRRCICDTPTIDRHEPRHWAWRVTGATIGLRRNEQKQ